MLDHLHRAETLAQGLGDSLRLGPVNSDMSVNFRMAGDIDRAIKYGQRAPAVAEDARRIAETINDPSAQIMACYGVSVVLLRQGHVQRAIPVLEPAMELCQDRHIPLFLPRLATALGRHGVSEVGLGVPPPVFRRRRGEA